MEPLKKYGNPNVRHFVKNMAPGKTDDPSNNILKISDMKSISIRTHEMEICNM